MREECAGKRDEVLTEINGGGGDEREERRAMFRGRAP